MSPNTYFPPYLPHELDVHPDGRRIQATIEAAVEAAVEAAEPDEQRLRDEIKLLQAKIRALESQLEKAAA